MRLSELEPKLEGTIASGVLRMRCPLGDACAFGANHWIRIRIHAAPAQTIDGDRYWQASGTFPESLSLSPSVNEYTVVLDADGNPVVPEQIARQGWHGVIENGVVR